MHYTFIGLSLTLAAVFLATGSAKILRARWTVRAAEHLGYTVRSFRIIGTLEIAAVAGLLAGLTWAPLGTAAAVGLLALLVGALLAHRRAGDPAATLIPPTWLVLASTATAAVGIVQ